MSASSMLTDSLTVDHAEEIALGSKGNHTSPIFSLPVELLEIVFIHGARHYYEGKDSRYFALSLPTWVNVSYVCQHWRNIALNCATLWTYHFNLSPRWTEELLYRSRQALLKISSGILYFQAGRWLQILHSLLQHSERIQELRLDLPEDCIPTKLPLRAPRLETLVIKLEEPLEGNMEITDVHTPVLRTIKLVNCSLPWHMFDLNSLNRLVMRSFHPIPYLNGVEFLASLGKMPNISVLHLHRVLNRDSLPDGLSHKIDLPHLALLTVSDSPQNVMALLSCIEIPLKAQLGLRLQLAFDGTTEYYAPISSFLAHRFDVAQRASPDPIFRSLTLFINTIVTLSWSTLERDRRRQPGLYKGLDTTHIPLQITLETVGGNDDMERSVRVHPVMAHMCAVLPMADVQTLYVHWDRFRCQFACWEEIFGCLSGLRYLMLKDGLMQDLSVLSRDGDRRVAPALEELELVGMYFLTERLVAQRGGMSRRSFLEMVCTREKLWDRVILTDCQLRF